MFWFVELELVDINTKIYKQQKNYHIWTCYVDVIQHAVNNTTTELESRHLCLINMKRQVMSLESTDEKLESIKQRIRSDIGFTYTTHLASFRRRKKGTCQLLNHRVKIILLSNPASSRYMLIATLPM